MAKKDSDKGTKEGKVEELDKIEGFKGFESLMKKITKPQKTDKKK